VKKDATFFSALFAILFINISYHFLENLSRGKGKNIINFSRIRQIYLYKRIGNGKKTVKTMVSVKRSAPAAGTRAC
jgi:hypothetical protein